MIFLIQTNKFRSLLECSKQKPTFCYALILCPNCVQDYLFDTKEQKPTFCYTLILCPNCDQDYLFDTKVYRVSFFYYNYMSMMKELRDKWPI